MAIELMLGRKVQRHPRELSKQQLIPSQEEGQVVQHPILELLASGWLGNPGTEWRFPARKTIHEWVDVP